MWNNLKTCALIGIVFCGAVTAPGTEDELAGNVLIQNFKTRKLKEDGQADWDMKGSRARSQGGKVYIYDLEARIYQKDGEVVILSTDCEFDRMKEIGKSNKKISIRTKDMTLEGVGFTMNIATRQIRIKRRVHMQIFHKDDNLLGK